MPEINFKISDNQKYDFLFRLLNPNFNEEGGWAMEYAICEVYDEYAIVRNFGEGIFERVYYTKDDANDSLEITNKERCYIVDVNETERAALDSLKGEGTYTQAVEAVAEKDATINSLREENASLGTSVEELTGSVNELTEQNSQYSTQIEELNNSISTLTMERDEAQTSFANANAQLETAAAEFNELNGKYATIVEERDILATYKKNVEDEAKKAVINGYVDQLSEEIIETYMKSLDSYTIEELDMKLTYEQKKANPGLFSKTPAPAPQAYLPKEDQGGRGINDILSKYER
jgi:myosin heavy subunit